MNTTRTGAFDITVITPTTGRKSLLELIASIDAQQTSVRIKHLLLWDDKREPESPEPDELTSEVRWSLVMPDGFGRMGDAPGSALRSIGLLAGDDPMGDVCGR